MHFRITFRPGGVEEGAHTSCRNVPSQHLQLKRHYLRCGSVPSFFITTFPRNCFIIIPRVEAFPRTVPLLFSVCSALHCMPPEFWKLTPELISEIYSGIGEHTVYCNSPHPPPLSGVLPCTLFKH